MKFTKGHYQAFWAYFTWGIFPVYWKFLKHISPLETLFHRVVWGCVFLGVLAFGFKKSSPSAAFQLLKKYFLVVTALAFFIACNWYIYVYAVNSGQILQGSLAYFITPLLNIVFGAYVFKESLSKKMKAAATIAAIGVTILMILNKNFPWIALTLAFTFSFYGVTKKKVHLGGLESSFLESLVMFIPALILAVSFRSEAATIFSMSDWLLLIGGGIITAIPILLFSLSTRSIPFNHLGILQFLAPTLQFLVGVLIYGENVTPARWIAFSCVWIGAGLYLNEIFQQERPKIKVPQSIT